MKSDANPRPPATVHVDLDGARAIYAAHGWPYPAARDPLFESGLQNFLDWLAAAGVRATLFVIAQDLEDPRRRELVQEAVRQGHRIGSHTLTHRKLTTLGRKEKEQEIFASKGRISDALGVEVDGFRAPGFAMDRESLDLVVCAGYAYDSSLFPGRGRARNSNLPGVSESPRRLLEESTLIELPMPAYAPLPFPFHPSYSLVLGDWYFHTGLKRFREGGAPLILLFHLTDLADPMPADQLPGWKAKFFTLSYLDPAKKRRRCEQMLSLVKRHYEIVDTAQLLAMSGPETARAV